MQDEINEKTVALYIKTGKLTAAFKEFSAKKLTQDRKPSIRKALAAFREKAKELNASRQQTKNKDREVSL